LIVVIGDPQLIGTTNIVAMAINEAGRYYRTGVTAGWRTKHNREGEGAGDNHDTV